MLHFTSSNSGATLSVSASGFSIVYPVVGTGSIVLSDIGALLKQVKTPGISQSAIDRLLGFWFEIGGYAFLAH
tara:strand:- start:551 stop:769 length:219 start_codon:yes stop_codon:yes gene_type:complete